MAEAILSDATIRAIVRGECRDPFAFLGPHVVRRGRRSAVVVRAFLPTAEEIVVVPQAEGMPPGPMTRIHPGGLFEAVFPDRSDPFPYQLEVRDRGGVASRREDPYRFSST
ncbi:MAG TPA: 1,4-alpha-glucan branching enzyme, partial [Candidatus Methylomirabilis sp.]